MWSRIRNYLYDKKIFKSESAPFFSISIGNITWGGTGKTALAIEIGADFQGRGLRVAFLSRGYGRQSHGLRLVSDGRRMLVDWKEAGDEPFLIARKLPAAIVAVAEKRVQGLELLAQFEPDAIILDDGFQHRAVFRDVDIVLIDGSEDITRLHVIPFGKLREPLSSVQRADALVLTHSAQAVPETEQWISSNFNGPVFHADYESTVDVRNKRLAVFCALAAPQHFFRLLEEQGAQVVFRRTFRDHHPFSKSELREIEEAAIQTGAEALVTTEKDAVRLEGLALNLPLIPFAAKLKIVHSEQFYQFLDEKRKASALQD